jgi:hypothetical protein
MLSAAAICLVLGFFARRDGRTHSVTRDALMLAAMIDTGHRGIGLVAPVLWVAVLVGFSMVAAAVASRSRLDTHRAQSLHSVGMILMAGFVAVSSSHGSEGGHAGMSVDVGAVSVVAAGLFAVASVVVARQEWSGPTASHRIVGASHHGAMAASVVLMAVVATA